ncbi:MAG: endolytic transglycosylase MltG [Gammaproteobacteria bacterium]|nr:endolytic transglycosylase MltG [Gammaproteobacteria bacterium]
MARGRMKRRIIGTLILLFSLGGGWIWMGYDLFLKQPMNIGGETLYYRVTPGATLKSVAFDLQRIGVLEHPRYFTWLARLRGSNRVQLGEYSLETNITPEHFLDKISNGKVVQYSLTVIEGWTFRQLMAALRAHGKLLITMSDASEDEIIKSLGITEKHLEGLFLPDTYLFPADTTDNAFLRRAYNAMKTHLQKEWDAREENLPYQTPYEALVMASIVEKETGAPIERPEIAGVFVSRLRKGMRLQTDPTVIYGMGDRYEGNIKRKDLLKDTPYNTYTRKGLPPTPIALPSAAALNAAMHPTHNGYLYFVAKGDGSHYFSKTNEEHAKAVREFQLQRRSDYRSSPHAQP